MFSKRKSEAPNSNSQEVNDDHFDAIVESIHSDNLSKLNVLLGSKNFRTDDRNENGTTGLMVAAQNNKVQFVEALLANKADVNGEDLDDWTPLTYAARYGSVDVCKILLLNKAYVNHKDQSNFTPIMWAAYYGYSDTVRLLAEYGAILEIKDSYGLNALMLASGRNHIEVVKELLEFGAKVNTKDKFGTTPIVYASRKGYTEIVSMLIEAGAGLDYRGIYGWSALLLAVQENYEDTVQVLLKRKQNVNIMDKQSSNRTPLMIACRKGNINIVRSLLAVGANPNLQDDYMNTALIYATKYRHYEIVNLLLQKHANINICGDEQKTALYVAIENQDIEIITLILSRKPDLEICSIRGDTPLLRAVRSRNLEVVQLLLMYRAKVTAVNKKGDNVMHIALRSRSKVVTEALLQDPRNAHLLYHANKTGETPYNLDHQHKTPILDEVFGATRLTKVEQMKSSEVYNLYCNILTEMFCEPHLTLPISVGIYAMWSSGKSIFLEMVRERLKEFAGDMIVPQYPFIIILTLALMHLSISVGFILIPILYRALDRDLLDGIYCGIIINFFILTLIGIYAFIYWWKHYKWMSYFNRFLSRKFYSLNLALWILFLHIPTKPKVTNKFRPIKFIFGYRKSKSVDVKDTMVYLLNKLNRQVELTYGRTSVRLFRALHPKPNKKDSWTHRKFFGIPTFILIEINFFCFLTILLIILGIELEIFEKTYEIDIILYTASSIILFFIVMHICVLLRILFYMVVTQEVITKWNFFLRRQQMKTEGIYGVLYEEVDFLVQMVTYLDVCTQQETRIVISADALGLCDNDRELIILDLFNSLFLEAKKPFILLLVIDPQIIQKVVLKTERTLFLDNNITTQDYLRSFINLPMCLRNIQKTSVESARCTAVKINQRKYVTSNRSLSRSIMHVSTSHIEIKSSASLRSYIRLYSTTFSKSKLDSSQKINMTEDDFFAAVNPRSMRTFMNILHFISRLLKYYFIDFNWYHLINWICITYQWPFRTSFLIAYCQFNGEDYDHETSLQELYTEIKYMIPYDPKTEPNLNLDEEERKFDTFLMFHEKTLTIGDLMIFNPFSIHLDKAITNYIQNEKFHVLSKTRETDAMVNFSYSEGKCACVTTSPINNQVTTAIYLFTLPPEIFEIRLSNLKVKDICVLFNKLDTLTGSSLTTYNNQMQQNNINGKVLLHCNVEELKQVLNMKFGDWETFRTLINELRYCELTCYEPNQSKRSSQDSSIDTNKDHVDSSQYLKRVNFEQNHDSTHVLYNESEPQLSQEPSFMNPVVSNQVLLERSSQTLVSVQTDDSLAEPNTSTNNSLTNNETQTNFLVSPDDIGFVVGTVVGRVSGQVSGRMFGSSVGYGRNKVKVSGRSTGRLKGNITGIVKGSIKKNVTKNN